MMKAEFFGARIILSKIKLLKIKAEGISSFKQESVQDLKIADYVVRDEHRGELNYEQALVLAMKREKAAFRLYLTLSERVKDTEYKNLFLSLAQEESRHKLRFELEYDEFILREN